MLFNFDASSPTVTSFVVLHVTPRQRNVMPAGRTATT